MQLLNSMDTTGRAVLSRFVKIDSPNLLSVEGAEVASEVDLEAVVDSVWEEAEVVSEVVAVSVAVSVAVEEDLEVVLAVALMGVVLVSVLVLVVTTPALLQLLPLPIHSPTTRPQVEIAVKLSTSAT